MAAPLSVNTTMTQLSAAAAKSYLSPRACGVVVAAHDLSQVQRVAGEVLTTERSYVASISHLFEHFIEPLQDAAFCVDLNQNHEARRLWRECHGALSPIVDMHKGMLQQLEEMELLCTTPHPPVHSPSAQLIEHVANAITEHSQYFKLYTQYTAIYTSVQDMISAAAGRKKLVRWISEQNQAYADKQSMQSSLIMPIQRIPR